MIPIFSDISLISDIAPRDANSTLIRDARPSRKHEKRRFRVRATPTSPWSWIADLRGSEVMSDHLQQHANVPEWRPIERPPKAPATIRPPSSTKGVTITSTIQQQVSRDNAGVSWLRRVIAASLFIRQSKKPISHRAPREAVPAKMEMSLVPTLPEKMLSVKKKKKKNRETLAEQEVKQWKSRWCRESETFS